MSGSAEPQGLAGLLDEIAAVARERERMSVADLRHALGERGFAPFLVIPALISFTPLAGIPFLPSGMALLVMLVAAQRVAGIKEVWLPEILLRRGVGSRSLLGALEFARPGARLLDKVLRHRLGVMTSEPAIRLMGVMCIAAAATVILLELIPFLGATAWAAIALFGLSLFSRDGLVAMLAFAYSGSAFWLVHAKFF